MYLYTSTVRHVTSIPFDKGVLVQLAVSQLAKNCFASCRGRHLIAALTVADRLSPNPIQSNPVCNIPPQFFTVHFSIMYCACVWCVLHTPPISTIWPSYFTGSTNYAVPQSVTSFILSFI